MWVSRRPKIAEGGWTHLGRLRVQLYDEVVEKGESMSRPMSGVLLGQSARITTIGIIHAPSLSLLAALSRSPRPSPSPSLTARVRSLTPGATKPPTTPHFLWITQFPLFTKADEDKAALAKGRWASTHHPFTAPVAADLPQLEAGDVERVRGQHYDLVLNGAEVGGGSVRIHDAALQRYVMREVLKLDDEEMGRFGHLLKALEAGAPPHGGIAIGESAPPRSGGPCRGAIMYSSRLSLMFTPNPIRTR